MIIIDELHKAVEVGDGYMPSKMTTFYFWNMTLELSLESDNIFSLGKNFEH